MLPCWTWTFQPNILEGLISSEKHQPVIIFSKSPFVGKSVTDFSFSVFYSWKLIGSGACASVCTWIFLIKIKNVQICLCGDGGVGKGKVNHTWHFLLSMLRILCTQALCARPWLGCRVPSAHLLSLNCGTHCKEDKTEIKIPWPADHNANSELFGTDPLSSIRKERRGLGCRRRHFLRAN